MEHPSSSDKVARLLHLVLIAFSLIAFRVWHLGVIEREQKVQEAQKPKLRTILLRADRGMICDRFQIPLATNRIRYAAAVYYGEIAQIPPVAWTTDEQGKRVRRFPRKEHIREMARAMGRVLDMDEERIEDLIHAKASLLPHVPYVIKANVSEKEYCRLKMMEKDWLGLSAERVSEREYPLGKTGCHLIGSLGSINSREYRAIVEEMALLQDAVDVWDGQIAGGATLPPGYDSFEAVQSRLYELKERAYTLGDRVGKSGIEGRFEQLLRGFWGLKRFEVDQKGRALRELPGGKEPIAGQKIVLSISAELQQFAEELLIGAEKTREGRSVGIDRADQMRKVQKQPWIKGGAIVALDPRSGEVLAFASHPRFDPRDFLDGHPSKVNRWLENERWIENLWDGLQPLSREWQVGRKIEEGLQEVDWEFFLSQILPSDGPLRTFVSRVDDVKNAVKLQEDFEALRYESPEVEPTVLVETMLEAIPSMTDRLFAIDLCRLAVCSPRFSDELLMHVGSMKLTTYHAMAQAFHRLEARAKQRAKEAFHKDRFPVWRKEHQKEFLAARRREEKEKGTYARPYIDYLDRKEEELFQPFWEENRIATLREEIERDKGVLRAFLSKIPEALQGEFLRTFRSFQELDRPLLSNPKKTEKDLAASFYPKGGFGFCGSYAYQRSAPQGSLFKLITAYEALRQGHFLSLIDMSQGILGESTIVAQSLKGIPYPRLYKGGRLPKSSAHSIGQIDLIGALEHSSNPYFAILAGDYLKNGEDLNEAARLFGFGEKSGIDLPYEVAGHLPTDLKTNRTGLYSYAIGQHTLLTTPLQAALMLAAFANGGDLLKPKIVKQSVGFAAAQEPFSQENRWMREELAAIGIPFPLFTAVQSRTEVAAVDLSAVEVRKTVSLPPSLRAPILEGMHRSVWGEKGSARPAMIRSLFANPLLMREYLALTHQMIGKTSTAEILFNPSVNPSSLPQVYKHVWFGAISFDPRDQMIWEDPELVVVVFLRFGDAGKEVAPMAAQMVHKWREIKKKHVKG